MTLGADFLGHLGGNFDWDILAVFYGLGRTILLGDFVAFFNRDLLTGFHWFLKGFLGTLLHRNLLAFLNWLLHRHLLTALLWSLGAMFTFTITRTDQFVSSLTLFLIVSLALISVSRLTGFLVLGGTFLAETEES